MKLVLLLGVLCTGCITGHNVEERCVAANLHVDSLVIEDTIHGESQAKVICSSKKVK